MRVLFVLLLLAVGTAADASEGGEAGPRSRAEAIAQAASAAQAASEAATRAARAAAEATTAAETAAKAAKAAKEYSDSLGATPEADASPHQSSVSTTTTTTTAPETHGSSPKAIADTQVVTSVGGSTGAQITANKDGGSATIKISQSPQAKQDGNLSEISLSSPLSKTSDSTKPATLDGLANAGTVGYTWGRYWARDSNHPDTTSFLVGGGGLKLGYQTFDYFDGTSLNKEHTSRTPASGSLFFGSTTSGRGNLLVLAKFEYQNAFKDADSKVLCPVGTAPIECVSGPIGTPKNTKARIWSIESRYTSAKFELSPTLSYDSVSRVKGLDVPIYFIGGAPDGDKPSPFNAGVSLGWRSDTHGSVGLFVGSPFSFWLP